MAGFSYDPEAIIQEADIEMAHLEAQGRAYAAKQESSKKALRAGDLMLAAQRCPHGGGYPLDSLAAKNNNDPRQGEQGVRCTDCGSVVSGFPWDGDVEIMHACESIEEVNTHHVDIKNSPPKRKRHRPV
jgi:hypothetical protein